MQPSDEYLALTQAAALVDLSDRGRICLLGADREKFLHGQVTNDLLRLQTGQGCYAALVSARGRVESDLFVFKLPDELLIDFEPGLTERIAARLEKFVIAEDVQVVDVSPHYGLLSVQGPQAEAVLRRSGIVDSVPEQPLRWVKTTLPEGELYLARNDRYGVFGCDLFVPTAAVAEIAGRCEQAGARRVGREACETARIENAIPRFGVDMDESNLAPETGIQNRAISYSKGCYIGQEVIARIRTYGQVAKALRLLRLELGKDGEALPSRGTKLQSAGKDVGYITSSAISPKRRAAVALGYVRKEANSMGTRLNIEGADAAAVIIGIPGE